MKDKPKGPAKQPITGRTCMWFKAGKCILSESVCRNKPCPRKNPS